MYSINFFPGEELIKTEYVLPIKNHGFKKLTFINSGISYWWHYKLNVFYSLNDLYYLYEVKIFISSFIDDETNI